MARLWGTVDGEPWMINPARLGILGAFNPRKAKRKKFVFHGAFKSKRKAIAREKEIPGAFTFDQSGETYVVTRRKNPRRKRSAKHMPTAMQRRMSYVRSFQKNRRHHLRNRRHRRNYRRNPYPLAGSVASLAAGNPRRRRRYRMNRRNPRRHYRMNRRNPRHHYFHNRRHRRNYRRNPGFLDTGYFGLPSLKTIGWAVAGFSGTAALQTFIYGSTPGTGLIPASWTSNADGTQSNIVKYGVLIGSAAAIHAMVRSFAPSQAATATIGASMFLASQIIHDLLPGVLPGYLSAYTPLRAYTSLRGMSAYHRSLASQNIGASNLPVGWSGHGAMDILPQRFRRFN